MSWEEYNIQRKAANPKGLQRPSQLQKSSKEGSKTALQWHFLGRAYSLEMSLESSPQVADFVPISSRCDMLHASHRVVQAIHQKRETHEVSLS